MTAKIPDDVVEKALTIYNALDHYDDKAAMRAAGEVFAAWEREQCAMIAENFDCSNSSANAAVTIVSERLRARSAPEKE